MGLSLDPHLQFCTVEHGGGGGVYVSSWGEMRPFSASPTGLGCTVSECAEKAAAKETGRYKSGRSESELS